MTRTLSLRRESLTELTSGQLANVAGAGPDTTHQPTPPQYALTYTCLDSNVVCWGPYLTQGASCDYC